MAARRDTLNANDMVYGSDGARLLADASGGTAPATRRSSTSACRGCRRGSANVGSADATVSGALAGTAFDRIASGQRRLTVTLGLDEKVAADMRVVRGGKTLARRQIAALNAGTRKASVVLSNKVAAGSAQVQLTLKDAAGNTKVVRKAVHVPKSA